jgi:ubiquinone/menaquinone biosynthesis C-methylase UbiE
MAYHPETYWSEVAQRIDRRSDKNIIAGDDSPFYRYKRSKFLKLLHQLDFTGKRVVEIGSGPGGNLQEVWKKHPATLTGLDISAEMIALARKNGVSKDVELKQIDGERIPLDDKSQDIVYSVTVLQHNTDEDMMKNILKEMCRVSNHQVVLFERIEKKRKGDEFCIGRTINDYAEICDSCGFKLDKKAFINIQISYITSGLASKVLNRKKRKEGEKLSRSSRFLQKITLPITAVFDKIIRPQRDLAKLVFVRSDL